MTQNHIVAIQADPLESLNPLLDSTLLIGLEAQKRGYTLFYYTPGKLAFENGGVKAGGCFVEFYPDVKHYFSYRETATLNLRDADVVLMRQDPPFDLSYITATHILESVMPYTPVLNNPEQVRNCPEKWFVNQFPEFIPPTLISADKEAIADFRKRHGEIIIKPLYGHGGHAVFHLREQDSNFHTLLDWLLKLSKEPLVIQKFLPEVRKGDLRVVLIDGEIAGQIGRIPAEGEIRSNFHAGSSAAKIQLTDKQYAICEALKPELQARGLVFAGIDLIGDYLIEINLTSPSGLKEINSAYNVALERLFWDAVEKRL